MHYSSSAPNRWSPVAAYLFNTLFGILWRKGIILGEDGQINLNQPEEAVRVLEQAIEYIESGARE